MQTCFRALVFSFAAIAASCRSQPEAPEPPASPEEIHYELQMEPETLIGMNRAELIEFVGIPPDRVERTEAGGQVLTWEWERLWPEREPTAVRLEVRLSKDGKVVSYLAPEVDVGLVEVE